MKISILTATYNRAEHLEKLYDSIVKNCKSNIQLEWLIMDDGSTDETKEFINKFIQKNNKENLSIYYYYQENQGKMTAINNLINYSSGNLIIECDSDDFFTDNAMLIIQEKYKDAKSNKNIYAMAFLKNDNKMQNIGTSFKTEKKETTMFDIYFKDNLQGDKALVFIADVRKKYKYNLEKNENFITEAKMYNEMDKKYRIICFNEPIIICNYLDEGYSKNIQKIFKENPLGYYEYFKQLLNFNMKDVLLKKRIYIIKHYILFSYLTKQKNILKNVKGVFNKFLIIILFIPGYIKSYLFQKNK